MVIMININLENTENAFCKYNKGIISNELHNYIINECKYVLVKDNIILNICGEFNNEEKEKLKTNIYAYYKRLEKHYKVIDKYDNWYRIMFILIGAILIIFSTIFTNFIGEILLIAGWVVIWEVFYDLFFKKIKRKVKQKKYKKLTNCKIVFNHERKENE